MKLDRPLCFLDLETTGTNIAVDRIIEFGVLKVMPDGGERIYGRRFNPGVPIPEEATNVHGIGDTDVANCPLFESEAQRIVSGLRECDIAGFNVLNYDIPLLWEELWRAGIAWDLEGVRVIDAGILFKVREERTLSAAVKFYCDRQHVDAHGAIADATATRDVLMAQLERYGDLGSDVEELAKASRYDGDERVDLAGKLVRRNGITVFGFGKWIDQPVGKYTDYLDWMLRSEFPANTKMHIANILDGLKGRRLEAAGGVM